MSRRIKVWDDGRKILTGVSMSAGAGEKLQTSVCEVWSSYGCEVHLEAHWQGLSPIPFPPTHFLSIRYGVFVSLDRNLPAVIS